MARQNCSYMVPNREPYCAPPTRCERDAAEGSEFCWQHDPERRGRKKAERERGYKISNLKRTIGIRLRAIGEAYLAADAQALTEAVAKCGKAQAELAALEGEDND